MTQFYFDSSGIEPTMGFGPAVPAGIYDVVITHSDTVPTRDKTGEMLVTTHRIISGENAGREVTHRFNTKNASQRAVERAFGELVSLMHVVGITVIQDTEQMHGIPHKINVIQEDRADGVPGKVNRITSFMTINGQVPGRDNIASAQPQVAAPQPAPQYQQPAATAQHQPPPMAYQPQQYQPAPQQYQPATQVSPAAPQQPTQYQPTPVAANGPAPIQQAPMQQAPMQQAPQASPVAASPVAASPAAPTAPMPAAGPPPWMTENR